jgi:hypothetical protein
MGVLHSPTRTLGILSAIVRSHALTTDSGLSPQRIVTLALSLAGVSRKSVQFIEVPTVQYPANTYWVEFDQTQDPTLFSAVAHDVHLPTVHKGKKGKPSAKGKAVGKTKSGKAGSGGTQHQSKAPPKLLSTSDVSVEVINGGGVQGIAGTTSIDLTKRGFHVLGATSAPAFTYTKSVVQYNSPADLAAARTVEAQIPGDVVLQESPTAVSAGTINLILGSDFTALGTPGQHSKSGNTGPGNLAKKYKGYSALTSVCKGYGTAFEGP